VTVVPLVRMRTSAHSWRRPAKDLSGAANEARAGRAPFLQFSNIRRANWGVNRRAAAGRTEPRIRSRRDFDPS